MSIRSYVVLAVLAGATLVADAPTQAGQSQPAPARPTVIGPMVGHVDHERAVVWLRPIREGTYELRLLGPTASPIGKVEARAMPEHDLCVRFEVVGLAADTEYRYEVSSDGEVVAGGRGCRFRTAPVPGAPAVTTLVLGSCASSEPSSVWSAMALHDPDGLVLLGDTPYIDTTDLAAARAKQRRFLAVPELAQLVRNTPTWGTWDDHDFGGNDTDGKLPGKERTRQAFVEYRGLRSFGAADQGVYTSFRRGPLEVFLLDTRWFARTELDAEQRAGLLGAPQWAWLEQALRASTATFKLLACGMIWDDKKNRESDDWGSYPHERERLERFLGEHRITGAVLVGGDIHVSRHLRYPETVQRVGYVLDQWIVSPLHDSTIPSLNVSHPALLWSADAPRTFLVVTADTSGAQPKLTAAWVQDRGHGRGEELYRVEYLAAELAGR